ncbi:unnamed protein product [Cylindrotheca closterium]|uniref:Uncharacterized protein n=1 Tax=Cylindrotheca closterium TaxID=2856 RepID=A0AAD2G870_9STRA|nr:unnamed protein product [Cylindrotheca closterium]
MPPIVQDSVISDVMFEADFGNSDNWTHFNNDGNAFRSDFKSVSSSPNTTDTSRTWSASSDSSEEPAASSPLHHGASTSNSRSNSSPMRQLMSEQEEEQVQHLVNVMRKEYKDVNTEAAQRKMVNRLSRLKIRSKKQDFAVQELSFQDSIDDRVSSIVVNKTQQKATIVAEEPTFQAPEAPKKQEVFDQLNLSRELEDDVSGKPISFLNTSGDDTYTFGDDDTLTLSLGETEASEYERAERVDAIKESVMDILMCSVCTNPMSILTGNYNGHNDSINISNDDIHLSVDRSHDDDIEI